MITEAVIIEEQTSNGQDKKAMREKAIASAKAKSAPKVLTERRIRIIEMHPETLAVRIEFDKVSTIGSDLPEEDQDESSESTDTVDEFRVKSPRRPHKDFVNKFKKLTKFAMLADEIADENIGDYQVTRIKISGDMLMKKSRVEMVLSKYVERTGKWIKIPVSQVTMYGETDFPEINKLTKTIEELCEEAISYAFDNKYEIEVKDQLPLFS